MSKFSHFLGCDACRKRRKTDDTNPWKHFDFIEIGTSNFRTLTQFLHGSDTTCILGHALLNWDRDQVLGIAVDPVEHLLECLPVLPGVTKVPVAIADVDGEAEMHFARSNALSLFPGAYSSWLSMGTGKLWSPHPHLLEWLQHDGIDYHSIAEVKRVPVWSFRTLAMKFHVQSVDILKVDCEGADCSILEGVLSYCDENPDCFPRILQFETNELTHQSTIEWTIEQLKQRGYQVCYRGRDTVMKRSIQPQRFCCDFLVGKCIYSAEQCFFDHPISFGNAVSTQEDEPGSLNLTSNMLQSTVCCFGRHCVRGHGDAGPNSLCLYCKRTISSGEDCWCDLCWDSWRNWEHLL